MGAFTLSLHKALFALWKKHINAAVHNRDILHIECWKDKKLLLICFQLLLMLLGRSYFFRPIQSCSPDNESSRTSLWTYWHLSCHLRTIALDHSGLDPEQKVQTTRHLSSWTLVLLDTCAFGQLCFWTLELLHTWAGWHWAAGLFGTVLGHYVTIVPN
jgi:hypothetical protein